MEKQENGEMEIEKWRDEEMERWGNGEMEKRETRWR